MRITPSMKMVRSLVQNLGIKTSPLNSSTVFSNVRRETIMNEDWQCDSPYNVSNPFKRKSAGQILSKIQNSAFGRENLRRLQKTLDDGTCWEFDERLDKLKHRPSGLSSQEVDLSTMILNGSDIECKGITILATQLKTKYWHLTVQLSTW